MTNKTEAYSAKLRARNPRAGEEDRSPQVGIFWIHPETNKLILRYAEPLECGVEDRELKIIDAGATHRALWGHVKDHHPDLSHLKYDQVPRGRVFYNHETKNFHVWGPESRLKDPHIQEQILSNYSLSRSMTVFEPNEDYELKGK
jgi:hypothetical protein